MTSVQRLLGRPLGIIGLQPKQIKHIKIVIPVLLNGTGHASRRFRVYQKQLDVINIRHALVYIRYYIEHYLASELAIDVRK